jgi:hypothetical protein
LAAAISKAPANLLMKGSCGKELPRAAALAAVHCRRSDGFAASLFADILHIPHRLAPAALETSARGQHARRPTWIQSRFCAKRWLARFANEMME